MDLAAHIADERALQSRITLSPPSKHPPTSLLEGSKSCNGASQQEVMGKVGKRCTGKSCSESIREKEVDIPAWRTGLGIPLATANEDASSN